jgi:hypothetical protein
MTEDLARLVALTAFRSSADLGNLVPILKQHCSEEEYRDFLDAITHAMTTIDLSVTRKAKALIPGIEAEWDAKVAAYGRVF